MDMLKKSLEDNPPAQTVEPIEIKWYVWICIVCTISICSFRW
jgi:hypothetical protein